MAEGRAFLFLCDQATESECLTRQLMGTPQANALWAMTIQPGDHIYLFNFNTRFIRGPYTAVSSADCHEPSAWRGKFPVQVRIATTSLTRVADGHSPGAPGVLSRRRPVQVLGAASAELFSWIQVAGNPIEPKDTYYHATQILGQIRSTEVRLTTARPQYINQVWERRTALPKDRAMQDIVTEVLQLTQPRPLGR
jgi:hypothetical protein